MTTCYILPEDNALISPLSYEHSLYISQLKTANKSTHEQKINQTKSFIQIAPVSLVL